MSYLTSTRKLEAPSFFFYKYIQDSPRNPPSAIIKSSMATTTTPFLVFLFLFLLRFGGGSSSLLCNINAIYQFGDSISDTGNLIREDPVGAFTPFARLPYGETFFNRRPTGRCSNGLLMIDFLAKVLHLPLLNPYLDKEASFRHGVNFAVAGSTALVSSVLAKQNILNPVTNSSLMVQLNWFKTHLKSICSSETECKKILEKALFMVGEIGGNDYNYALLTGKTIDDAKSLIRPVVQNIKDVVRKVIDLGAVRVVVPGNFPIGCMPIYLTAFKSNDSTSSYDEYKCLRSLNKFAWLHNVHLKRALQQLRKEYPNVDILYADYYNAFQSVFRNAALLGFEEESVEKACCGDGGEYNFDMTKMCGTPGVTKSCPNPERRISWDGVHLTEKAYEYMAEWLMLNLFPKSKCN